MKGRPRQPAPAAPAASRACWAWAPTYLVVAAHAGQVPFQPFQPPQDAVPLRQPLPAQQQALQGASGMAMGWQVGGRQLQARRAAAGQGGRAAGCGRQGKCRTGEAKTSWLQRLKSSREAN